MKKYVFKIILLAGIFSTFNSICLANWSVEVLDPEEWLKTQKSVIHKDLPNVDWTVPDISEAKCVLQSDYDNNGIRVLACRAPGNAEFSIIGRCNSPTQELFIKIKLSNGTDKRYGLTLKCKIKKVPKSANQDSIKT